MIMRKEKKQFSKEERSEDFQDVLGNIPPWILRWGITAMAVIVVLLVAGSILFKYPDTIQATITLTSSSPTATIIAKSTGKIQQIFVKDKQFVDLNCYLAVIENPANINDVLYINKILSTNFPWENPGPALPKKEVNLGNFQALYSTYYTTLAEYIQFETLNYYKEKIQLTQKHIKLNKQYYRDLMRQENLIERQLGVYHKQFRRDSILNSKGLLADNELENTYNQFLQGKLAFETAYTTLENQRIQMEQMHESLYDTEYQYLDKKKSLELQLKSLTMQLQNEIKNWEMTYVLKAPISGKITFTNYWTKNQNISSGDKAFSIVPEDYGKLIGKALLPINRSGKVRPGQQVNIRFSNYPDTEFGSIRGVVRTISLVSTKVNNESNYVVEIILPNGLTTSYKRVLPFVPEMEGSADIITDRQSVLERFFQPLRKIISENL